MEKVFENVCANLHGTECSLFNTLYKDCFCKAPQEFVYTLDCEYLGFFSMPSGTKFFSRHSFPEEMPEMNIILKIMIKAISSLKKETSEDFELKLQRASAIIIDKNNPSFSLFKKWWDNYYLPDDAYEDLRINPDEKEEKFAIWFKEKENIVSSYLTPDSGEENILNIYLDNLN